MTTMLEQAIIDAKALREAAEESAKTAIVDKYADEVKEAVEKLVEGPDDLEGFGDEEEAGLDLGLGDESELGAEEEGDPVVDGIPLSHDDSADEVVEIDLNQIIAMADEAPLDQEPVVDREDIADEVGIDLGNEDEMLDPGFDEVPPANREEEININEEDLVNLFKEMLTVDVHPADLEEEICKDELEADEAEPTQPPTRMDGVDEEDRKELEELRKIAAAMEVRLTEADDKNNNYENILRQVKEKLEELNLSNARLLYTNRVLRDLSLNEQQKNKIAEQIRKATSVDEARLVFETLQKAVASRSKRPAQSLSEAVTKQSSTVISSARKRESIATENPHLSRWAKIAGLK